MCSKSERRVRRCSRRIRCRAGPAALLYGQLGPAACAPSAQDEPPATRAHPDAEAMHTGSAQFLWLICSYGQIFFPAQTDELYPTASGLLSIAPSKNALATGPVVDSIDAPPYNSVTVGNHFFMTRAGTVKAWL
jgi:hypothetical protein